MEGKELMDLRCEYESSDHTVESFAELKGLEFWKMKYALQKGLNLKRQAEGLEKAQLDLGFKKLVEKRTIEGSLGGVSQIIIRTQGGLEIIIPI